jgi:hypothetical protein
LVIALLSACVTMKKPEGPERPPVITQETSTVDAVKAATRFGGETAASAVKVIQHRRDWSTATQILSNMMISDHAAVSSLELSNAVDLVLQAPSIPAVSLFRALAQDERVVVRQLAWRVAAAAPATAMAAAMDEQLTRAIENGDDKEIFIPAVAAAVEANELKSVYTLMRRGLMETGHESFARVMAKLNPTAAANDLMDYLALAPVEELRLMTLTSVDVHACMESLRQMVRRPPSVNHPQIANLFAYATSRNPSLAELGQAVVDRYMGNDKETLAAAFVRTSVATQVAFIEGARRRMNPAVIAFLGEVKKATPNQDVIEEIDELRQQ